MRRQLVARADDTPEAVHGRLRDYQAKTRPVLDLFRAKEVIVAVDVTGPVAQVQVAIREQLGSRCPPSDQVMARCPPITQAFSTLAGIGPPTRRRLAGVINKGQAGMGESWRDG